MKYILNISVAALVAASTFAMSSGEVFAASKKQYCRMQADRAARRVEGHGVGTGAALGAGAGGLYGGLTGQGRGSNIVTGLALGAVGGAVLGGASGHQRAKQVYYEVYHDCLGY